MKARLESGKIVILAKDCDCQNHEGPHCLALNDEWRARNERQRASLYHAAFGTLYTGMAEYIESEAARLEQRVYIFKQYHISKVYH